MMWSGVHGRFIIIMRNIIMDMDHIFFWILPAKSRSPLFFLPATPRHPEQLQSTSFEDVKMTLPPAAAARCHLLLLPLTNGYLW
jgi:hypothetical protein